MPKITGVLIAAVVLLLAVPVYANETTFTTGIDTWLPQKNPNTSYGSSPELGVGANDGYYQHSLMQFTDMFGSGTGQIPLDSTIIEAELSLHLYHGAGLTRCIYDMTIAWDDTATWNSIGGGIIPGTNAKADPTVEWVSTINGGRWENFNVTASLQDWASGTANNGWGLWGNTTPTTVVASFEADAWARPYLTVKYTPPGVTPEPVSSLLFILGGAGLLTRRLVHRKQ